MARHLSDVGGTYDMKDVYKSRVYTERPAYADFDAPKKFEAIKSIIARRLREHPNAICSYSGGADSDIMIDIIEQTRSIFSLPPVKYVFFNTGLEMKAIKDHVKDTEVKYGVEIEECRSTQELIAWVKRIPSQLMNAMKSTIHTALNATNSMRACF